MTMMLLLNRRHINHWSCESMAFLVPIMMTAAVKYRSDAELVSGRMDIVLIVVHMSTFAPT
jgi:hypothetical protein